MTFFRWPTSPPLHSCLLPDRQVVIEGFMHCRISCFTSGMLAGHVLYTLAFRWLHRKITLPKYLWVRGPGNWKRSYGSGIFPVDLPDGQIVWHVLRASLTEAIGSVLKLSTATELVMMMMMMMMTRIGWEMLRANLTVTPNFNWVKQCVCLLLKIDVWLQKPSCIAAPPSVYFNTYTSNFKIFEL